MWGKDLEILSRNPDSDTELTLSDSDTLQQLTLPYISTPEEY